MFSPVLQRTYGSPTPHQQQQNLSSSQSRLDADSSHRSTTSYQKADKQRTNSFRELRSILEGAEGELNAAVEKTERLFSRLEATTSSLSEERLRWRDEWEIGAQRRSMLRSITPGGGL